MLIFEEITLSTMKRIFPVIVLWTLSMAASAQQLFRAPQQRKQPVRRYTSAVTEVD